MTAIRDMVENWVRIVQQVCRKWTGRFSGLLNHNDAVGHGPSMLTPEVSFRSYSPSFGLFMCRVDLNMWTEVTGQYNNKLIFLTYSVKLSVLQ